MTNLRGLNLFIYVSYVSKFRTNPPQCYESQSEQTIPTALSLPLSSAIHDRKPSTIHFHQKDNSLRICEACVNWNDNSVAIFEAYLKTN